MTKLLPIINSRGIYTFGSPLDVVFSSNIEYTCIAIRALTDYISMGVDPYATVYQPLAIDTATYASHLKAGEYVVSLQQASGTVIHVPSPYITSYPSLSGVPYRSLLLCVKLPCVPLTEDISNLTTSISNLTTTYTGMKCTTSTVDISDVIYISTTDHALITQARANAAATPSNDHAALLQANATISALRSRITAMESAIASIKK